MRYVVFEGRIPGLYWTWDECKKQITKYKGAKFKKYASDDEAKKAFDEYYSDRETSFEPNSLCVDASSSYKEQWCEYRFCETSTGDIIYASPQFKGTNNTGEFLGLVNALAYLQDNGDTRPIYCDSATAIAWVTKKYFKSHPFCDLQTDKELNFARKWLQENEIKNKILKWHTDLWGEIPADYGRK